VRRRVTRSELDTPLLPYDEAVRVVVDAFKPLPPQAVPLTAGLGLVAAADVVSRIDVPGFESSAMDGYAVRSTDVTTASPASPVVLRVVDEAPAGHVSSRGPAPGEAVKIMTGGAVPPGADAIVPWEDTEPTGERIAVVRSSSSGKYVRPLGEDVRAGDRVVAAGDTLTAVHLGVLASIGSVDVSVVPLPRVAILSTGDEVVSPGEELAPGRVYDANATLLAAMATSAGAIVVAARWLADDPRAIASWLAEIAPHADLIVTTGGASVGEHDWLRDVLERDGRLDMWRVAMKPGKPVAFGSVASTRVLALPGNPGSAFACAHTFVVPAIRAMSGRPPGHRRVDATLSAAVAGSPSRTLLCRVRLASDAVAEPLPAQSSVVLSNLLGADGFAIVPPGGADAGAVVAVEVFEKTA
jgi:molybdenum cofactor synthesis domain-containing protein